jgi:squalene-hopene/tetraprenyl-beta-curcumene cyclase
VPASSTASQTAWAVLGLLAAGDREGPAVTRGIQFLLSLQNADGTWPEDASTGTGFPNVFYLTYAMYRDYFPLLALATHAPAGSPLPTGLQL